MHTSEIPSRIHNIKYYNHRFKRVILNNNRSIVLLEKKIIYIYFILHAYTESFNILQYYEIIYLKNFNRLSTLLE